MFLVLKNSGRALFSIAWILRKVIRNYKSTTNLKTEELCKNLTACKLPVVIKPSAVAWYYDVVGLVLYVIV